MNIEQAERKHKVNKNHLCWKCGYSLEEHIEEANRFNNSPDFNYEPVSQKNPLSCYALKRKNK